MPGYCVDRRFFVVKLHPIVSASASMRASGVFSTRPSGPQSATRRRSANPTRVYSCGTRSGVTPVGRHVRQISSRSGLHSMAASGLTSISALLLHDVDREAGRRLERGVNVDVLSLYTSAVGVTESVGDRARGRARVVRCSRSQPPRRGVQSVTLEAPRLSLAGNRAKITTVRRVSSIAVDPPSPTLANFDDLYQINPDLSTAKYELHNYRKWRNAPGACRAPQLGYRTPPLG